MYAAAVKSNRILWHNARTSSTKGVLFAPLYWLPRPPTCSAPFLPDAVAPSSGSWPPRWSQQLPTDGGVGGLRVSIHYYTSRSDIEALLAAMDEIMKN